MKNAILFSVLILATFSSFGQTATKQHLSIDSALSFFKDNYPQEKVLLQTDKKIYSWNETIWMKTWCTLDGLPSYLSRILYVDLKDDAGKVVLKKMYKIDSLSSTPADLSLPETIKSGNYSVNAYTLWMLNSPEYIATLPIFIYGNDYATVKTVQTKPALKMSFFPEGGNMIDGIENRVAFKIIDNNGYPINLSGKIVDGNNKLITSFSLEHDGMGAFSFTPEKGNNYVANITAGNGAAQIFKLPTAIEEGIGLQVENTNANRVTVILNRAETNKEKYGKLKIVAQMNGRIVYAMPIDLDNGQTAAAISKKNLASGILQITIFTENDMPLCERIVFVENYSVLKPQLNIKQLSTKPRSLNELSMDATTNKASLSVMVTDATNTTDSSLVDNNILSSIFLTSDLKGHINQPSYYFKDKNPLTLHHLDLLLMTQGWRRFDWKKILNNEFATPTYPVESAMDIRGAVTKSDRIATIKKGFVSFIIKTSDSATILAQAKVTDKGEFILGDVNFMNKAAVAYMGTDEQRNKYIVDVKLAPAYIDSLNISYPNNPVNGDTASINSNKALAAYLYDKLKMLDTIGKHILANVTVRARKLSTVDSLNNEYADGPFVMGKGINPDEFKNYRSIWQIIQAAVPGITITGSPFDPTVSFNRYQGLNAFSENTPATSAEFPGMVTESNGIAYFLNGMNISKDIVNTISVDDVAFIKVLKQEASVLGASQGAIIIYTKKGAVVRNSPYEKTYTKFEKTGYAIAKEFYVPDYKFNPSLNNDTPDKRDLLYWNAKPITARDGKYHFVFFNNDISKKYKLLVQGIDANGHLIYEEIIMQ